MRWVYQRDDTTAISLVLPEGKNQVTLLGVLLAAEEVYVGADQAQIRYDNNSGEVWDRVPSAKLSQLGELPVVWGYWGDVQAGEAFRESVMTSPPISTWRELGQNLGPELRRLTQEREPRAPRIGALFAGFLEGRSNYLEIDQHGMCLTGMDLQEECWFSGNGRIAARVGYETARRLQPEVAKTSHFAVAFEVTIEKVDILQGPLALWCVTKDGTVTQLS
jgi:hypothetical protein